VEFLGAVLVAFGVVFVAELGDKTQLLALNFGARNPLRVVFAGLVLGFAAAGAVAALVGGLLGAALPDRALAIGGGIVFLVFAVLALRQPPADDDESARIVRTSSVIASIAITIALAEFGDKTQLATATLASRGHPIATWLGATGGEVAAGFIGAVAGSTIGSRLRPDVLRYASAAMFAIFGIGMLLSAR
jgi:putative Ca2+/H+ antiporter (TMEM165/GDT1 family)